MALSNYTELQSSLIDWIARNDLTGTAPDFVRLFEADFNRRVRCRKMQATVTLTLTDDTAPIPDDYAKWINLEAQTDPVSTLRFVPKNMLRSLYATSTSGFGDRFTIDGSVFRFAPIPQADVVLTYYQKLPPLADQSNGRNWLMDDEPDAYLSGAMARGYLYNKDTANFSLWQGITDAIIQSIKDADADDAAPSDVLPSSLNTP